MWVSHDWLRDWVAGNLDAESLRARLTLGGLEVVSAARAGAELPGVVVAEILQRAPHPRLPKLSVCKVRAAAKVWTLVCGAGNAEPGCKTALALPGAKLPGSGGDIVIGKKNIGGVDSHGMLCSSAELGLDEQTDGILILDADAQSGIALAEYLGLRDTVFELELTPNRGDWLGMRGIAREISALTGAKWRGRAVRKVRAQCAAKLGVTLRAPESCPRYAGRAVRGIDMRARTPDWMAERLRRGGLRRINIVVDITNYVMLELGQPMHAFDLDKIAGGIIVRRARAGEKLRLLDKREIKTAPGDLLIADHKKAIALAGVMGGENSAIGDSTRNVYFEAAYFPPSAVLGCARRFGLHTDAAQRFERGVDAQMQAQAIERATRLLLEYGGGEAGVTTDVRAPKFLPRAARIEFPLGEIPRLLGVEIPPARVRAILQGLGMRVESARAQNCLRVRVPSWRADVRGAHDLVEEIGRVHGFDKVRPRAPFLPGAAKPAHAETEVTPQQVKQKLAALGYCEAITYSFVDARAQKLLTGKRGIALQNPIAENLSVMRVSLWPGLLDAARTNFNRRHERVRLFEIGAVFSPNGARARETQKLAAVAGGGALPLQWGEKTRALDFFDVKGDLESLLQSAAAHVTFQPPRKTPHPALHPGRSAALQHARETAGHIGELHPQCARELGIEQPVFLLELDLAVLLQSRLPRFAPFPRNPAAQRDLAVETADEVRAQDVLRAARAAAGALLAELELFDVYAGARIASGKKSFAFRLTFQSESGNLTAEEVDARVENIMQTLQREFGARRRGQNALQ